MAVSRSRRRLLVAVALTAGVAGGGCSSVTSFVQDLRGSDNAAPPAPLVDFTPSAQASIVWERNVGASAGGSFLTLRPAIAGGRVFAAERGGDVRAFALDTGDEIWKTATDTRISGGPGLGDGLVLVGTSDGEVLALSAESGKLMWRQRVSSEVLAAPSAAAGVAVVRTQDGKLVGLSSRDGARLWIYDRAVPALSLRGTSTPVIAGNTVVAGFDNGRLVAIGLKDGLVLWESQIAVPSGRSELERLVDIDGDPVVFEAMVYVVTFQGRVAAVDGADGRISWRRDMSSHSGLAVSRDNVYVTDEESFVWALDRGNSASVWRNDKLARRQLTPPAAFGRHVVVGDAEGYLHFLDREDGRLAARLRVDGAGLRAAPVAVDDLLVVYGRGGTLSAVRVE